MNSSIIFIENEEQFLRHFGKSSITCDITSNTKKDINDGTIEVDYNLSYKSHCFPETSLDDHTSSAMSVNELNNLINELDQERHNMIDAIKEKELRASEFENALKNVWLDLCDTYDKKSCIKEISRPTLHCIYNNLSVYITHCSDYGDRDLSKKIKKEIEQTKLAATYE
jgi:hypothetical protein